MSNQSINPNKIDWLTKHTKRVNDQEVTAAIASTLLERRSITMLSLPAKEWLMEKALARSFPKTRFTFYGMERDKRVYLGMKANAAKLNRSREFKNRVKFIALPHGSIQTVLASNSIPACDVVYFDWMGTWAIAKEKELQAVFEKDLLKKESFLLFTICLQRGQPRTMDQLHQIIQSETTTVTEVDFGPVIGSRRNFEIKTQGVAAATKLIAECYNHEATLARWSSYPSSISHSKNHEMSFLFRIGKTN